MSEEVKTKSYSYDEVLKSTIEYFHGDELAATTWINKYCLRRVAEDGTEELMELNPDMMHRRLAREFARVENKYPNPMSEDEIYELFRDFRYIIPQGGSMSGVGNNYAIQSLSNCFVVGEDSYDDGDSYGAIFLKDQQTVQIEKRRGGVGIDISNLRPAGAKVTNAAKTSSGAVTFMSRFSNSTNEVAQNGRRGALMITISVAHPDAEAFIDAKLDKTKVTGANISVKVTDEFMNAVKLGKIFIQKYPITATKEELGYSDESEVDSNIIGKLIPGKKSGTYYRYVNAKNLWNKIIHNATVSAEPGVLFWDKVISESPADQYADKGFRTISTNPCGELPLCPYDSCRLFAINLYSFVINKFTDSAYFDSNRFRSVVYKAQKLMDDMVDLELEKIDMIINKIKLDPENSKVKSVELDLWTEIRKKCETGRRTGLGVTAEGDMIAALGLTYASDASIILSEEVHRSLALSSYMASIDMAESRGSFDVFNFKKDIKSPFCQRVFSELDELYRVKWKKFGRRNIANLTLAPTGTTSLMCQTTSGIEPAFRVVYKRRRKTSDKSKAVFVDKTGEMFEEYTVFHHKFVEWYQISHNYTSNEIGYSEALNYLSRLNDDEIQKVYESSPYFNSTANDIDWVSKVKMQGIIQKWIDHSISCTVNMPKGTTEETVSQVYETAWSSGCKGVTVYVDGSRDGILISNKSKSDARSTTRPEIIEAKVIRFRNGSENWIAFVGVVNGKPFEVFSGKVDDDIKYLPKSVEYGKIHKKSNPDGSHRYDFSYEIGFGYTNVLPDIGSSFNPECYNYARFVSALLQEGTSPVRIINVLGKLKCGDTINTWNRGVARALKSFVTDGSKSGQICPYCGSELVYYNGCTTCPGCGKGGKCD